jgi:stage V sporulation protein R
MNEGWASYWHSKIMTEKALKASEIIDYADHNAGVLATAPGQFNPYKIGIELLRDIEERWDKGRFGREWNECQNLDERRAWDKRVGLGRKKLFEVRKLYNDVTFIDEFFTTDFCERNKFFSFSLNERSGNYEIDSREFQKIKDKILFQLTNFGDPFIFVEDSNHENRGELLIRHRHEGTDLQVDHARDTLSALARVWRRPVNLVTLVDGKQKMLRFDGKEHTERSLGS